MKDSTFKPPIRSFFILDTGGVPLFARRYEEDDEKITMDDSDAVLFSGFLAAVEMFSRTNLHGELRDIGFSKERYFFSKDSPDSTYLIVLSAPTNGNPDIIENNQIKVVRHILEQSIAAFKLLEETSEEHGIELASLASGFGTTLDSIILETAMYFNDNGDVGEYESASEHLSEMSSDIQSSTFERTLERIRAFFRR